MCNLSGQYLSVELTRNVQLQLCEVEAYTGYTCTDIDECAAGTDNCDPNAACTNTVESFKCECNTGYTGDGVTCTDINECAANTDNCGQNAACFNIDGSFICECNTGYNGDGVTCTDINECAAETDNCGQNAFCSNIDGSFICECNTGYNGDGVTCTDINECAANTDNCGQNAACFNIDGSFICECNTGYNGDGVTCTDINECAAGTDNCGQNAFCSNIDGSFICECNTGYNGDGVTCTDINECAANTDNCGQNAACSNIDGSFICECNTGYNGDGVTCTDINECAAETDNCGQNAFCSNIDGSFICECNTGYNGDGVTCTDINECAANTDNCGQNAACFNIDGSFICECNTGYNGDGVTCTDINECAANTDNCGQNAACFNIDGSFICECNTGYNGDGVTCTDINECAAGTDNCGQNAVCSNIDGSFICECNTGYNGDGVTCTDINECAAGTDNCGQNAVCSNIDGSFACECNTGYNGDGVTCSDINECAAGTDNCGQNAACSNIDGSFTCECNAGYAGDGVTCRDTDECVIGTDNCDQNAACTNTDGSFTCECNPSYTGDGVTCSDDNTITNLVCEHETLHLECGPNQVMSIVSANYGRLDRDICSDNQWNKDTDSCISDVALGIVRANCETDNSCDIAATNTVFGNPCGNIFKYLEVSYVCLASDCYSDAIGREYRGSVQQTVGGKECQSWTAQDPHGHTRTPENYPDAGLGEHNYCRNPDDTPNGPWCYTTDPNTRWAHCPVSNCDTDECATGTDNCDQHAACTNTVGSFTCECNTGFTGDGVTCTDDNVFTNLVCEHETLHLECGPNQVMSIISANYGRLDRDICSDNQWNKDTDSCISDVALDIVRANCENVNSCDIAATNTVFGNPCGNIFKYLEVSYVCLASDCYSDPIGRDYRGSVHQTTDDTECQSWTAQYPHGHTRTPENYPDTGLGEHNYCRNPDEEGSGPWCYTTDPNTRWAHCPVSNCDIDECAAGTDNCDPNAACTNTVESFTCTCNAGFTGDGISCRDIDECAMDTDNCDANAACSNIDGSFTCVCDTGYDGDGTTCTDIDECAVDTDNCDVNAACSNTDGSYTCECNAGYTGDGVTCIDIDECAVDTDNCDANAACSNTDGSFTCVCNADYIGDGVTCTDDYVCEHINFHLECPAGQTISVSYALYGRQTLGVCTDRPIQTADCAADNSLDVVQQRCEGQETCDILASNDVFGDPCVGTFKYLLIEYSCDDIDECAAGTDNCDPNAACTNTVGFFTCECNAGFTGDGITCTDTCQIPCTEEYDPVCGNDAKTYDNICVLRREACNNNPDLRALYSGECGQANCPIPCTFEYSPVCGSNGKTYPNMCALGAEVCATGEVVAFDYHGECRTVDTCPPEWISSSEFCYFKNNDGPITFLEARSDCQARGATLTSVRDEAEQRFLTDLVRSDNVNVWIGLSDVVTEGSWIWDDGTAYGYTNWAPQQPDNYLGNDDCVHFRHGDDVGLWNDYPCDSPWVSGYICKMRRPDTDECATGTDNCDVNAVCTNTEGSFTCTCKFGYTGDGITCHAETCPPGWISSSEFCYFKNNDGQISFLDARTDCQERGSELTSIHDEDEQRFLNDFVRSDNVNVWIGLTDIVTEGSWIWDDGTPYGYTNWAPQQPDNSGGIEDCAHFRHGDELGLWNDLGCESQWVSGYICKMRRPDTDECATGTDNCDVNAVCTNTEGSFTCTCKDGYTGDGVTCHDIDECVTGTDNCDTNADCTNTDGSFTCKCNPGYSGNGITCRDIDECAVDTDNCDVHADCTNTDGSFTCACNPGHTGDGVTCHDIDECVTGTDNCDTNAVCTNTDGSFTCTCNPGYNGNGITCRDIDECDTDTDNCDENGECTNTDGSFTCKCNAGYAGDGVTCHDINECVTGTDNCDANADCTNTDGSFTCECSPGYTGNGITCSDIDECVEGTDNCDGNAACTNTDGSFTCRCNPGYTGDGVTCIDIDECVIDNDNCDPNAACINNPGSFTCTCNAGYAGDGLTCTVDTCPPGWTSSCEFCYFKNNDVPLTFWEARSDCQERGSELTSVRDEAEQRFLNDFVRSDNVNVWIGLTDVVTEGSWKWDDGTLYGYTNWAPQQPDNSGGIEDCAHFRYGDELGLWNDLPCDSPWVSDYICKMRRPDHSQVRLVDGQNTNEGRVEVFHKGVWGTVCDNSWDDSDALVVCRQLGFLPDHAQAVSDAQFGEGTGPIWLDGVSCSRSESLFDYCSNNGWERSTCEHSEDAGVICNSVLITQDAAGVEDGRILDNQLTASSEFCSGGVYHRARNARLNHGGIIGAWSSQVNDISQWIQAELPGEKWVTGVKIQGRADAAEWVTYFKVLHGYDGNYMKYVQDPNTQTDMVFDGSTDQNTVSVTTISPPVLASFVRVCPTEWYGHISMRFEVLVCDGC
ncbi:uncharacterized protein [Amphiura filiformis]|uniref:uncharacterized protein isoform X4 n=1 Tax=Amphiura filiformis TaxID=82378 RepID=UPI003B222978